MSRRGPIVVGIVGVVLLVLIALVLVLPKAHSVNNKQKQVAAAEQMEQTLRLELQQLKAEEQQAPQDRQKLALLTTAVPTTADLPSLIRFLNTAAGQAGISFMQLSPGQPTTGTDNKSSAVPATISGVGDFFVVDQFLRQLEQLPRAIKIQSMTLSPGGTGLPQLQVSLSVEFFTTDTSAGPGSIPGPTGPGSAPAGPAPSPSASPSPSSSGSPSPSHSP